MKSYKYSIVIITKNRLPLLTKCLLAVQKEFTTDTEILVVDTGSTDGTRQFLHTCNKAVRTIYTRMSGYKYASYYNTGIKQAKGTYIIIIDDDCIVQPGYRKALETAIPHYPQSILQGSIKSIPQNNLYARIMGYHYQEWIKLQTISGNTLKTLDNKNVAIPKTLLSTYGSFSSQCNIGSEDIELGYRMRKHGVLIRYIKKMKAFHHERTTLKGFISQHIRIAQSERNLDTLLTTPHIRLSSKKKIVGHLRTLITLCKLAIKQKNLLLLCWIPFVYGMLAVIRIYGYSITKRK